MKKNIYLAQINVAYSDRLAYIPYAAGCIAAYAWNDPEIKENFNLGEILFLREKVNEAIKKIKDPAFKTSIRFVINLLVWPLLVMMYSIIAFFLLP